MKSKTKALVIAGVMWRCVGMRDGSEPLAGAVETGRKRVGLRSVDLWGLRVGLTVARPMAHNGLRVYVRWRLEALTFQLRRMFDRRTNVK